MNIICKVLGHKVVRSTFGMKWCSRCEKTLDWGAYGKYLLQEGHTIKIPKFNPIKPEDL